jgi:hypothetical protein
VIDYTQANNELAKKIHRSVSGELKKLEFIKGSTFESLQSPREYNFSNDSINCEFEFSRENIENIKKYVSENKEAWERYLRDNFTSCSGFMSFYENHSTGGDWGNIELCLEHDTKSGSVLEFILLNEGFNNDSIYDEIEFCMSNYITNYGELIGE